MLDELSSKINDNNNGNDSLLMEIEPILINIKELSRKINVKLLKLLHLVDIEPILIVFYKYS